MATKLNIDTGVKEYEINGGEANGGGVLRFNPADPNVYERFVSVADEIEKIEADMVKKGKELNDGDGRSALALMRETDLAVKAKLQQAFGAENDFDAMLGGVNLLAVAANGERIITNLIAALQPIMEDGLKTYTRGKADAAVATAKANRAQRRAAKG